MTDEIRALLHEFYESFFPLPSQFEKNSMSSLRGDGHFTKEEMMNMENAEKKTTKTWYMAILGLFAVVGVVVIVTIL